MEQNFPWYVKVPCILILLLPFTIPAAAQTTPQLLSSSRADTWVATDGMGRTVGHQPQKGIRPQKHVGIFYFIWQGAHGYDRHSPGVPGEGVMPKSPGDTASPYDISLLLKQDSANPKYGPMHAFHYWGEPWFGYYLADDEWVIRKHAQMLSDVGVDVIILDVTNAAIYQPQVSRLVAVYRAMRKEGKTTPAFAFIVNTEPEKTVKRLYEEIYKKGLFSDLWFYWKGKPLLLCPPEALTPESAAFFQHRQSWAWSKGQKWFADGKDKWTWLDHTPQSYGWHESPDKAEQISVAIAQHPVTNIGRSFQNGKEPEIKRSGEGIYFNEQWERALAVDPEFVYITGWNEWVAMRFASKGKGEFLGRRLREGESFFVDLYNEEFSRDAEPVKGSFNDNYYYQMAGLIRQYKGARPVPAYRETNSISIDGRFADWKKVKAVYADDAGDTFHRKHPGWGRIKEYVNTTGRNDIVECRITSNKDQVFFYVKTAAPLTAADSANWMQLYVTVKGNPAETWEGFQFMANARPGRLARLHKNWQPQDAGSISYRASGNELELAIPKSTLGVTGQTFTIDFKWADNVPADGNPMHWLDKGDAAPNARFAYRYVKE